MMRQERFRVKVWEAIIDVTADQSSKTVWVATGTYLGQTFSVKNSSASSAVKAWVEAARYRGN